MKLAVFQSNVNIQFIYAVRQIDKNTYVFIVDPDPEDPAEFGEEIVITEGLIEGRGCLFRDRFRCEQPEGNQRSIRP